MTGLRSIAMMASGAGGLVPPRRDAPVMLNTPGMTNAADASLAIAGIVRAVSEGDLTPTEGAAVAELVEAFRRTLETEELEGQVAALESQHARH